ncbi:protein SMAX1-LIKE 6-like [Primulina huaijiensis]|uniref:protein SMAX1-LIKE 6-like n=1 Tax=Primulina huaijiensis TaxID=1492673 RepID=UPI003CC7182D
MPTPVSVARQCLAEEAAATLDDAVAVAKRRSHPQTTSLHAISALLALPSSSLREACTRVRSSACPPRLHFRALELCVGVALDKVSACKSSGEDPPVSNSLMAAIKRSQANQRRHPDTFHLYQQQLSTNYSTQTSISVVKVELRHFVVSILDDPIVSRVFSDAGFRTNELKLAVINPLTTSRFSMIPRCPPLFQWGLSDLESKDRGPNFLSCKTAAEIGDENSRRVGEILAKGDKRNPLMIGVCAKDALSNFMEGLKKGETGFLPKQIDGLSLISVDHEFSKFINKDISEEMMELKFKELDDMSKNCHGTGMIVNCGDLNPFVDAESVNSVNILISRLKSLLSSSKGKLWVIGFLAGDDDYKKLLERFPCIDMELDLQMLPITSSKPSASGGNFFKSSLMGSFVPFGGFFPMPSEQETQGSHATQSSSLCNLCNEKYEQEVSVLKRTPIDADYHSTNLSSWLPMAECETSKRSDTLEAQDDKTLLDFRVMVLHRKWSGICQQLHRTCTSQDTISEAELRTFSIPPSHNVPTRKHSFQVGSVLSRSISPGTPSEFLNCSSSKPKFSSPNALESGANVLVEVPAQSLEMDALPNPSCSQQQTIIPTSDISLTTDLGLGTLYASNREGRSRPNLQEQSFYKLPITHENTSGQEMQAYTKGLEYPWKILSEKICWQFEAIQTIGRTLFCCRDGDSRHQCPKKGNHWLSFLGPDKVAKRKIAATLAEIVFGGSEHFLSLDLSSQDATSLSYPGSIFYSYNSIYHDLKSERKMIVDCLADELRKRPFSVILLENIEKADFLVQNSLSQAVKTGKFPDSHGRDISINKVIFVIASRVLKSGEDLIFREAVSEFSEEKILQARNLQMQILIGSVHGDINSPTTVSVTPSNGVYKRKLANPESTKSVISKRSRQFSRSIIDLNLPVEDMDEDIDICRSHDESGNSENSEVWLEELLIHVDENVVFEPFDFDSLAKKILKDIDVGLQRTVGTKILLEIDQEVMVQILAAAWLMERENALEDWIEQVLFPSIKKARQRYNATSDFVLKLVSCDGLVVEEQAPGVCLPARVIVN